MAYWFCKIPSNKSIKFPNECFICGGNVETTFAITHPMFSYYVIALSYKTWKINVPVCERHLQELNRLKFLFWLLSIASVGSGIYFIDAIVSEYNLILSCILFVGLLAALKIESTKYFSMKNSFRIYQIQGKTNGSSEIVFLSNREDYFLKLCILNECEPIPPPQRFLFGT